MLEISRPPLQGVRRYALTAALLSVGLGCSAGLDERPPDVIVLVIDTMRKDHLSCYGYERNTSPNVDRLAREGTLFEDATAQSSWTMPSMVSMLSGRYVTAFRDVFEPDAPTLAEQFQQAGYRTIGVVSNSLLSVENGFDRGFDRYDASRKQQPGVPGRPVEEIIADLKQPLNEALEPDASGSRPPLFVYLHFLDPHDPYVTREEWDAELPLDGAYPSELRARQEEIYARDVGLTSETDQGWAKAYAKIGRERGAYDQEVRHTDEHIGRLLKRFEQLGLTQNAIIAVVADHGEGLWEHVTLNKPEILREKPPNEYFFQTHGKLLNQNLIGTPFILWGRGVPKGKRIDTPIENVDLYPTLLELADLPLPTGLDGKSLLPLMLGRVTLQHEYIHSFVAENASIRDARSGMKLIDPSPHIVVHGAKPQLFDLSQDKREFNDLAPSQPAEMEELRTKIADWIVENPMPSSQDREKGQAHRDLMEQMGYAGDEEDADEEE